MKALYSVRFFQSVTNLVDTALSDFFPKPTLVESVNLLLLPLTILVDIITSIESTTATDSAIAVATTATTTATDSAIAVATTATTTATDSAIAATTTATTTATDSAIAATTTEATAIKTKITNELQYMALSQIIGENLSWKKIEESEFPSLGMDFKGWLTDKLDHFLYSAENRIGLFYNNRCFVAILSVKTENGIEHYQLDSLAPIAFVDNIKTAFCTKLLGLLLATATDTDTATATDTDTAIAIDDKFQVVTFLKMTNYLFYQQSWKKIDYLSLDTKQYGWIGDRIDLNVWKTNKIMPVFYNTKDKMIVVKAESRLYGCLAGYSLIEELKWEFAHQLLYDLEHGATATVTATDIAIDTVITSTESAAGKVPTETEANRSLSKYQKLWYLEQINFPGIDNLKGIADINSAIVSVSTFISAYNAVTNHGIPKKDPNKASVIPVIAKDDLVHPKKQQAFLLKQNTSDLDVFLAKCRINGIRYNENGSTIGLTAYNKKKHFVSVILNNNLFDLFVDYKKDQAKKSDEQMAETIAFCKGEIGVDQIKPYTVDTSLPVATTEIETVEIIPSTKAEIATATDTAIADTTVDDPDSDPIALPSTIKVNGTITIKKP